MTRHGKIQKYASVVSVAFCAMAFLLQTWSPTFIQFDFEINREAIVAVFCINKDKPEMHCEGRCHLEKQLQTDRGHKHTEPGSTSEFPTLVLAPIQLTPATLAIFKDLPLHMTRYGFGRYSVDLKSPFRPPRV